MRDDLLCVYVISSRRPNNVRNMMDLIDPDFIVNWIVRDEEDYFAYQEKNYDVREFTIRQGGDLICSRNIAINDAFTWNRHCIIIDDDLKKIEFALSKNNKDNVPITFKTAVRKMYEAMVEVPQCYLCGTASTNNAFFFNPMKPISLTHFIGGWFMIIKNGTDLRFDPKIKLKEDYDYTLQHITKYGGAIRCNFILADFAHFSNKGGVVDYRTEELEQETIAYLKKKWNGLIKDHPRRKNEILLNVKIQKS